MLSDDQDLNALSFTLLNIVSMVAEKGWYRIRAVAHDGVIGVLKILVELGDLGKIMSISLPHGMTNLFSTQQELRTLISALNA